jgi:hypothetical protein
MSDPPSALNRFLAEARRRKVHRVAAIYVAVAIPLLEAADLLAPVLLLPEWAYRALGAVVLVGLPMALLASWTFDLTWAGIERTEPLGATAASGVTATPDSDSPPPPPRPASEPGATAPTPSHDSGATSPTTAPRRRQTLFAVLTAATLVMGGLGWRIATPRTVELDEQTVAILPFRVSADPSLDYLGEGLIDLLAARLPGDVGPLALDTRTVLAQLERRGAEDAQDVPLREALDVARDLGASGVLLGSVVGSPDRITADAVLYGVATGREGARLTATAPEDNLGRIGDELALSLLGQTAIGDPRLPAELTDSLEALRSYLRGVAFIRKGRFLAAMDALERALAIDSTFAMAGQELGRAACWTFDCNTRGARGRRLAWTFRDRLSPVDRARVEAAVGPRYPAPSPGAERLAGQRRLVELRPDDWQAWYVLAWVLWRRGPYLGLENTAQEGAEYYHRGMSLGCPMGGVALNASLVFYHVGDTAALRQVTEEFLAGENGGGGWWRAEGSPPAGGCPSPRRSRLWGGIESPDLNQALVALWAEGTSEAEIRPAGRAIRAFYRCLVGLAQLRRDFELPANPDRSVRDPLAADPRNSNEPYYRRTADMCSALLGAWKAVEEEERIGDVPGALSTIRRQVRGAFVTPFGSTRVREEGRLAALNGDVEGGLRTLPGAALGSGSGSGSGGGRRAGGVRATIGDAEVGHRVIDTI